MHSELVLSFFFFYYSYNFDFVFLPFAQSSSVDVFISVKNTMTTELYRIEDTFSRSSRKWKRAIFACRDSGTRWSRQRQWRPHRRKMLMERLPHGGQSIPEILEHKYLHDLGLDDPSAFAEQPLSPMRWRPGTWWK